MKYLDQALGLGALEGTRPISEWMPVFLEILVRGYGGQPIDRSKSAVRQMLDAMSHVKGAIYDGWACLGSANFDALSLQVNRELNIATSHPPVVEELLQRVFLADMAKSVELTEPFPREWWDFLTGLIADVL